MPDTDPIPDQSLPDPENNEENQPLPGSQPLYNDQHERFANLVVSGMPQIDAFEKVGYKRNSNNASRLRRNPLVDQRIQYLRDVATQLAVVDAAWIRRKLEHVVDLATAVEEVVDDNGKTLRKPAPTFSLSSANRALELLGKDHGMFKERIELGGQVAMVNTELLKRLRPEERQVMRQMLVAASARTPTPANDDEAGAEPTGVVPTIPSAR